jgi:hypothetical protein
MAFPDVLEECAPSSFRTKECCLLELLFDPEGEAVHSSKTPVTSIRPHGVTSQKIVIFAVTTIKLQISQN